MKNHESRKEKRPKQLAVMQAMVFLHEGHRQYFSAHPKQYEPFLLPRGYTTRAAIKDYFTKTYGLTLAVRPPHRETSFKRRTVLWVNAQILLGEPSFCLFPKSAVLEYTKRRQRV